MTTTITGATGIDNIQAATGAVIQVVGKIAELSIVYNAVALMLSNQQIDIVTITPTIFI